ncbi:MAG: enolase C-terminal domain-like protein [Pseudomonadota bacterium]
MADNSTAGNIVVSLVDESGVKGFGEGIPRWYVTGESTETSLGFLRETLLPALLGREVDPEGLWSFLQEVIPEEQADLCPAAFCAVETALLDLGGRLLDRGLIDYCGGSTGKELLYSGVLPFSSPDAAPRLLSLIKTLGFSEVKIKVGGDRDEEMAALARDMLGPKVRLRLDANGAWTPKQAVEMIDRLGAFGVDAVEQPVPKTDFAGLAYVTQRVQPCVIADESLCTRADALRLIKEKAVGGFNLRLSKCGGFFRTSRLYRLAREEGLTCMLGSQVGELGFLSAAGRHFAAGPHDLTYLEGCYAKFILGRDLVAEDLTFGPGGQASPLEGPGLGVQALEPVFEDCLLFSLS